MGALEWSTEVCNFWEDFFQWYLSLTNCTNNMFHIYNIMQTMWYLVVCSSSGGRSSSSRSWCVVNVEVVLVVDEVVVVVIVEISVVRVL